MLGLLFSLLVIVSGIALIVRSRRLTARTTGVVVAHRGDFPVFRFVVEGVGEFEVKSAVGRSWPRPRPGTSVRVRYDPAEPRRAQIDEWGYRGAGVLFVVMGLLLLTSVVAFR